MNDGKQLLVHFENKAYSDNLLRADKLIDVPVKVTPHRALNSSRCVIGCKELRNMDEEDIKNELQSQGVIKVERMKRWKDGQLVPSDSYILTINSPNIPPQIKVGFLIRDTKVYIPNPQRCFNCQKYGHNKRFCKNEAKCGQAGHDDHECDNEAKCANCNGDHPAYVRSCPKWKIEKEVIKVKYQKNIPFHEARQQVEGPVTDPSKNSYATVSKSHQWTSNIKAPNTFKTEEEWLTHTIDSLLKRLDAIKAKKINTKQTIHQFCLSIMWYNLACACLWTHKWIKKVKFSICNAIKRSTWYICCSKWWKWNGIKYNNPEKSYPWG